MFIIYVFTLLVFFNTSTYVIFQDIKKIDNKIFKLAYMQQESRLEEQYYVEDKPVDKDFYFQAIAQAMTKESNQAYQDFLQKKADHDAKCADLNQKCLKKILSAALNELNPILKQIFNPSLDNFYAFSHDTIKDRTSLTQLKALFVDFNNIAADDKSNSLISEPNLRKLIDSLPSLAGKLSQFFEQSKNNAIQNCHDTKILKELLDI
jgi:hypothetical protein